MAPASGLLRYGRDVQMSAAMTDHVPQRTLLAIRRSPTVIRRSLIEDDTWAALQVAFAIPLHGKTKEMANCHQKAALALLDAGSKPLRDLIDSWPKFSQMAKYIGEVGMPRATILMGYNDVFGLTALSPETPKAGPPTTDGRIDLIGAMVIDIASLPPLDRDALKLVRASKVGLSYLMSRYHAATTPLIALKVVAACQRTGGKLSLIPDDPVKLKAVEDIYAVCPPGAFPGFANWGAAESASPADNIREHCLKHVFHSFPAVQTPPPMAEIRHWWAEFDLIIKLTDVLGVVPMSAKLDNDLKGAFGGGYAAVPDLTVDPLVDTQIRLIGELSGQHPALANLLLAHCQNDFAAKALAVSTGMTDVQVHLFKGIHYMISGINGSYYAVGRASGGVPLLSSAYVASSPGDKANSAKLERLWQIQ